MDFSFTPEHRELETVMRAATWQEMVVEAYRDAGVAVLGPNRRWSGPELLARAAGAAAWLESLDIPPGTPVPALFSATTGEVIAATLGAAAIERPTAPLAPRLTVHELAPVLEGLRAPVIVTDAEAAPLGEQLAARTGARWAVLPTELAEGEGPLPVPAPDALLGYLHTSGTTGAPKPV